MVRHFSVFLSFPIQSSGLNCDNNNFLRGFTLSVPVSKSVAPKHVMSYACPIIVALPYTYDRLQFPTDRNLHSEARCCCHVELV